MQRNDLQYPVSNMPAAQEKVSVTLSDLTAVLSSVSAVTLCGPGVNADMANYISCEA